MRRPSAKGSLNPKSIMSASMKKLFLLPALLAALGLMPAGQVTAQTFTNLHSFTGTGGSQPRGGLILSGNTLYGTTIMTTGQHPVWDGE
jgi:hypothetical protein